jgi:general transcription factor 3C polypeptide 5 (transcription factor C subunit 1)
LPQTSGPVGEKQECILEELFPSSMTPTLSWLNEPNKHLFLLPPALSRMDTPNPFCYRNENVDVTTGVDPNAILKTSRTSRKYFTQRITFDDNMVIPTAPLPAALKDLKARKLDPELVANVKKMFENRPVWSKISLQFECEKLNANSMRYILPCLAYYFTSGPWRLLWVRFGYNPRDNPDARIYQLVDYRVQSVDLRSLVKSRNRARTINLPNKHIKNPRARKNFLTSEILQKGRTSNSSPVKDVEAFYKFRKGIIPAHSNMLYQVNTVVKVRSYTLTIMRYCLVFLNF